jgi:hypothetical protein
LIVLAGVLLPLLFNFAFFLKLIPDLVKDFSPLAFAAGGICFSIGILRYRLANVRSVPRREPLTASSPSARASSRYRSEG